MFNLIQEFDHKINLKYDNYDAIEVSKVNEIPIGYKGLMGVPITFMNKYNPEQFEIIDMDKNLVKKIDRKSFSF